MNKQAIHNLIKAFMIPVVAFLLVLPLAAHSPSASANPAFQEATATVATGTGAVDLATPTVGTVATPAATAVVATTNQNNDFPWWWLLIPLALLLLIPFLMRRQQTQVVTRTTETTPPPTRTTISSTQRTERKDNDPNTP